MGISHALAPVFDICRDPRFGRMGETYGEDPTLAAAMGTAYVKGLQDKHRMSACSKHFLGFMAGQGGIHTAQAVVSRVSCVKFMPSRFRQPLQMENLTA